MSTETTTDAELLKMVRTAIADPGQFFPREYEDRDGERIYETIPHWGARAVLAAIFQCTCGQPAGSCDACGKPRCWHCDPGLGRHHKPMRPCSPHPVPGPARQDGDGRG